MILNLFILGCLKDKPLNLDFLIETADFIKLNKWTTYKKDLLLDKLNTLVEQEYIRVFKTKNSFEKHKYVATEKGILLFRNELEKYIESEEINIGMLLLFLTFASHFSKKEIIELIEKKIQNLNSKLTEFDNSETDSPVKSNNNLETLTTKARFDFRINEISLYSELLDHIRDDLHWKDFLNLKNIDSLLIE